MGHWANPEDIAAFNHDIPTEQVEALITHAEAMAVVSVPELKGVLDHFQHEAVRGIIVGAVVRWAETGSGAYSSEASGPFSVSVNQTSKRGVFWPSELKALRGIVGGGRGKAYEIDMTSHADQRASSRCPDWWV